MPRGGRPLVMAKAMAAWRILFTAAFARSVSTLSCVTSVPSTSARRSLIGITLRADARSLSPRYLQSAATPVHNAAVLVWCSMKVFYRLSFSSIAEDYADEGNAEFGLRRIQT